MVNTGWYSATSALYAMVPLVVFGGLVQFLAGMWAYRKGDTFAATVIHFQDESGAETTAPAGAAAPRTAAAGTGYELGTVTIYGSVTQSLKNSPQQSCEVGKQIAAAVLMNLPPKS